MARGMIVVLDSVGCGAAEDAEVYGDAGADTLGHIAERCAAGDGDRAGLRRGPLLLPHLDALGLGLAMRASTGKTPPGFALPEPSGQWGYGVETSRGKDTPSGHWEIAGTPVRFDWGYFPRSPSDRTVLSPDEFRLGTAPLSSSRKRGSRAAARHVPLDPRFRGDDEKVFPADLTAALIAEAKLPGILGDCHGSGTRIIEEFGEEHVRSGKPICYTSADSVFQIAAHEESFGLERLYEVCRIARKLCDSLNIGRVIARPFLGSSAENFVRTSNRKDFSIPPLPGNIFARASAAGREIVSIGKIGDIFAHRDTGRELKGKSNADHVDLAIRALGEAGDGAFIFVNLVDFDSEYGHRRDVPGYAACLEAFDARLPEIQAAARPGDLIVLTADHGNDPTWRGFDHTREHVPILAFGPEVKPGPIGARASLADISETIAEHLGLSSGAFGQSWL